MQKKNSDSAESLLRPGFWPVRVLRQLATAPIVLYQRTLSPDHGPSKVLYPHGFCRFYPSCSEYTRLAVLKRGIIIGYLMGVWRVIRCNPFSVGGVDKP